jgi:exopolysaccharide biosynthesis polyprenyl glycosylphosphotransferase
MSRKFLFFWLIVLPDLGLMYLSLWLTVQIRYQNNLTPVVLSEHFKIFSFLYLFWLLIFFIHGLFEVASLRRYAGLIFNLFSAMLVNLLLSISFFYLQKNLDLTPRRFLLLNAVLAFGLVLIWHMLVKYFLKNRLVEEIYLFSFNQELAELEKEIQNHNYLGYKVVGHLNEEALKTAQFSKDKGIILPGNLYAKPEILAKFYELRKLGVSFFNYEDFYEQLLRKVYLSQLSEVWFLENIDYTERRFYNLFKRAVDIILGFVGFVFFLVTFPFCALLIKISSRGPIFFVQERIGKNGRLFKVYKYRTMSGGVTDTWTSANDPRITTLGRILRKSRLDEFPQFINLLLGNMSLVGPRPEQPHLVEKLKKDVPFYDERHLVKPGLTGWAQLNIYAGSIEESKLKLQYDLYYIKHRSIIFDMEIIFKTIYYIFTWQGR